MDKKEEEILQNTEGYQQYEESFIVGQYECDCNGRIKAGALTIRYIRVSERFISLVLSHRFYY